jgi:hypothetical protein
MPIVLKCGSLNLLEPSGSIKACNGIALPTSFGLLCPKRDVKHLIDAIFNFFKDLWVLI